MLPDTAHDSDTLRRFLTGLDTTPVIQLNKTYKRLPPFDTEVYKQRKLIERAFPHLKDWRRFATRHDKLSRNFKATVTLAMLVIWWV